MAITEEQTTPNPRILKAKSLPPNCVPRNVVPARAHYYHHIRKAIHVVCVLVFLTLPLSNLIRFDIPNQRFFIFGQELWISEFATIFFTLMFLLFIVAAMSMFYGRVYCSYLCPQMIFSEASLWIENKIKKSITKYLSWKLSYRNLLSKALFYLVVSLASILLAFVFICYFVEPRDLLHRLLSLDVKTAGGIAGATTTMFTLLDFLFLRQRFCTTVCPYGYLQGMLADGDTLLVQYRDDAKECIECKKCVRICHMGIDIRTSPQQIECIHCGECIDACVDVLGRLGKQGLIHYAWGSQGEVLDQKRKAERFLYRIGFRDTKRVVVFLVTLIYAAAIVTALAMRKAVLVEILPDRSVLYRSDNTGTIYNTFRITVANRGHTDAHVQLSIEDLPDTHFQGLENGFGIQPEETRQIVFDIAAPPGTALIPGVNHFRIVSQAGKERSEFEETFITPAKSLP